MFSQFEKLLENSDQLTLSVSKVNGKLVVSTTATIPNPSTETASQVRQSLSAPFVVSATAKELDEGYASALDSHIATFNHRVLDLANVANEIPETTGMPEINKIPAVVEEAIPTAIKDEFADIEEL